MGAVVMTWKKTKKAVATTTVLGRGRRHPGSLPPRPASVPTIIPPLDAGSTILQKANHPRRMCTPNAANLIAQQRLSVDLRFPPHRPQTSISPISQELNHAFCRNLAVVEAVAEKRARMKRRGSIPESGDCDGTGSVDFPKQIHDKLLAINKKFDKCAERMQVPVAEEEEEEDTTKPAGRKLRPLFEKRESDKKTTMQVLFSSLELFRDDQYEREDLTTSTKKVILERGRAMMAQHSKPFVAQNRLQAYSHTLEFVMNKRSAHFGLRDTRASDSSDRRAQVAEQKDARLSVFQTKVRQRQDKVERAAFLKQNIKLLHKWSTWLPAIMWAAHMNGMEKVYIARRKVVDANAHRMSSIIKIQRWFKQYFYKMKRKVILRGFRRLQGLIEGYHVRWLHQRRVQSAPILVKFFLEVSTVRGVLSKSIARRWINHIKNSATTIQGSWHHYSKLKKAQMSIRMEQVENVCKAIVNRKDESEQTLAREFQECCRAGGHGTIVAAVPPRHILFKVVDEHRRAERHTYIKALNRFRQVFRETYRTFEIEIFDARAASLMCKGKVVFPVFQPPPRPENLLAYDDPQTVMKLAVKSLTGGK